MRLMDVVVRSVEAVAPRIKSFELADPAGAQLPAFTAGSHIDVTLPNGLVRSYSLLNDSRERDRYVIAVLHEEAGGGGSAWVHESLRPGDVLEIGAPQNRFEIDEGGDHNILIAGGIGITPILSMAQRFDELGIDYRLIYCTRSREDAAFCAHIEERHGERATLHHDGGLRERSLDVDELLRVREPGTHVYVCGPPGLIAAVRKAAGEWPQGTVLRTLRCRARRRRRGSGERAVRRSFAAAQRDAARAGRPLDSRRPRSQRHSRAHGVPRRLLRNVYHPVCGRERRTP